MQKPTFLFRTTKEKILDIRLKQIDVIDTKNPSIASLLGMDILQFFEKIVLTKKYINLIK